MSKWAFYNENNPAAAEWLRNLMKANLIAPGVVCECSIEDIFPDDLRGFTQCHFFSGIGVWSYSLRQAGWPDNRPIWTGSAPCQGFSAAGQRKGFFDERHLWPAWFHLIDILRPVSVIGEQVASSDALAWLDLVSADMEEAGYSIGSLDICAAGFGAPHQRQRLYWAATKNTLADTSRERKRTDQSRRDSGEGKFMARAESRSNGGDNGEAGELADAAITRSLPGAHPGVHSGEEGAGARDAEPERHGSAGFLADSAQQRFNGSGSAGSGRGIKSTDSGDIGILGYANSREPQQSEGSGARPGNQESGWAFSEPSGPSATGGVADTLSGRRQQQSGIRPAGLLREAPESRQQVQQPGANSSSTGVLGHSESGGCGECGDEALAGKGGYTDGASNTSGELGKSDGTGREQGRIAAETTRYGSATESTGSRDAAGPVNGFWRDADWLLCRDGKWRPTESRTEPMADGLAAELGYLFIGGSYSLNPLIQGKETKKRIERLRGYGNAICAPQAEAFIRAYMSI